MVESGAAQSSVLFMLIDISLVRHRRCHGQKKKNLPSGAAFWAAQTGNLDALKRLVDAGASLKVIARWMQRILPALRPLGIWTPGLDPEPDLRSVIVIIDALATNCLTLWGRVRGTGTRCDRALTPTLSDHFGQTP